MKIKLIPAGHPFETEPMEKRVNAHFGTVLLTATEFEALKAELAAWNALEEVSNAGTEAEAI